MRALKLTHRIKKGVAIVLSDMGILPGSFNDRLKSFLLFENKTLVWNSAGYWFVSPMPSAAELNRWYANAYWGVVNKKGALVESRDIDHFAFLLSEMPGLRRGGLRCLNFGAGHGGISYLFHALGHEVVNVEPSGLPINFDQRWTTISTLEALQGEFDLIYGSHSLEHVADLDAAMYKFARHLKWDGYVFFEVPNCRQTNCRNFMNGGKDGNLIVPHTYYFTTDYFRSLKSAPIINATYDQRGFPKNIDRVDDGEVIRYLGKGRPMVV